MPASGDFARSAALQAMFAGIAADGMGATKAGMRATEIATDECFATESDPVGAKWAPLAPSTLRGRPEGPILGGLIRDLKWQILGIGRWRARSQRKPYMVYHLGPDARTGRPERPFQPVRPDDVRAFGLRIFVRLGAWLDDHRRWAGL